MKALVLWLTLLALVYSSSAGAIGPALKKFYPLKDMCPMRPGRLVAFVTEVTFSAWVDNDWDTFHNALASVHASICKDALLNNGSITAELRDEPEQITIASYVGARGFDEEFDPDYVVPHRPSFEDGEPVFEDALTQLEGTITSVTAASTLLLDVSIVLYRHTRSNVHTYAPLLERLKGRGIRVLTVDFGIPREQAIATGSASAPHSQTVFVYDKAELFDATALVQSLRRDPGRVCVVSGNTHIHTFDGMLYRHDNIGDYVLYKQLPFMAPVSDAYSCEIQVRKSQCESMLKRMACITGVGIRESWESAAPPPWNLDSSQMTIQYDREHNDVVFTYLGHLIPSEAVPRLFGDTVFIERIEPDVGIRVIVRRSWSRPAVRPTAPVLTMEFYSDEDVDPVILVHGTYAGWMMSYGMCGTYDACTLNDFVQPDGRLLADNKTKFAEEWRVQGGASIFEWAQYASDADPGAFTLRQPLYDVGWKSQAKDSEVGSPEDGLNDEALFLLCAEACARGVGAAAWLNEGDRIDEACNKLCDDTIASLEGLNGFDVHTDFRRTVPKIGVAHMNGGQKASIRVPIGGTYVFGVHSSDCCNETGPVNVTVTVQCERDFTVDAGEDVELELQPFPMPIVRLTGKLSNGGSGEENIHFSWRIIEWPYMPRPVKEYVRVVELPPALQYPHSLTTMFKPTTPGTYTLELVAFDGCRLATDRVKVSVACLNSTRVAVSAIGQQILYTFEDHAAPFTAVELELYETCPLASVPVAAVHVRPALSFIKAAHPLLELVEDAGWRVMARHNVSWAHVNETSWSVNDTVIKSAWVEPLPKRDGFVRVEGRYRDVVRTTQAVVSRVENHSFIGQYHAVECAFISDLSPNSISLQPVPGKLTWPGVPQWITDSPELSSLIERTPFDFGVCEGVYNLTVNVSFDVTCEPFVTSVPLDVSCGADWTGPLAKPIFPCFPVQYDYTEQEFPSITLSSDSSDRWNRDYLPDKSWIVTSSLDPTNWTFNSVTAQLTTVSPGVFSVEHVFTNGCGVDRETMEVVFECAAGDVYPNITCPPEIIPFNASGFVEFLAHPFSDATLRNGQPAPVAGEWIITQANGTQFRESFSGPSLLLTSTRISGFISPTFSVQLEVSDNCRRAMSPKCDVTITCPNDLVPQPSVAPDEIIVTSSYSSSGIEYFANVEFTHHSTSSAPVQYQEQWRFFANSSLPLLAETFTGNGTVVFNNPPGQYYAVLRLRDLCQTAISSPVPFKLVCSTNETVIEPYITVSPTIVYLDNGTTYVSATMDQTRIVKSRFSRTLRFLWTLLHPDGVVVSQDLFGDDISQLPSLEFLFTASKFGMYTLTLSISDGCVNASESVFIYTRCIAEATPNAESQNVTWDNNKFPIVTLDGTKSVFTHTRPDYVWTVLEAPAGSLFEGQNNVHARHVVTETDEHPPIEVEVVNSDWESLERTTTTLITSSIEETFREVQLLPRPEAAASFGACFRPDRPGVYTLELSLETPCETTTKVMTVTALCNGEPDISKAVVPTSGNVWDRVELDATGVTDPDQDDLSYEWRVYDCMQGSDNITMYNLLLNRNAAKALFLPAAPGKYCIALNVSDGCSNASNTYTVSVGCPSGMTAPELEEQSIKVKFDGLDLQQVNMEIPIDDDVDPAWYDNNYYSWTLIGWEAKQTSPRKLKDGDIAGIVVGSIIGVALIAGLLGLLLFFLKGTGAEGPELSIPPKSTLAGAEMDPPGS